MTDSLHPPAMDDEPDLDGDEGITEVDMGHIVRMPDVNAVHEVVNLLSAQRGYEANASAVETTKSMAQRALDIIR